ncbi:MAG: zinc-dependent alcohol dehydrogenase family protein [Alphaproteobacteria bacterium]|nr:zinc-dependent alcohol dehydrogenase family protein [Alphaproteobacteria bacterium]
MKMQGAVLFEQGMPRPYADSRPLSIETLDLEGPGEGEVLVELAYAGLCRSDLSTIAGARPRPLPTVPGHEAAGIVREIGPGISDLKPGDHVVMVFVMSCGGCPDCVGGKPNLCGSSSAAKANGTLVSGSRRLSFNGNPVNHAAGISCFAEYAVVSRGSLVRIDNDVPLADAALFGCAVITGVGAVVNTAKVYPGAQMAVVGLGGVGLNALLGGVVAGASDIIAVDVNESKLALARQLGATHTFNAKDPDTIANIRDLTGGGLEFVFEVAGSIPAWETAYALTKRGGTVISAGLTAADAQFTFHPYQLVSDEKAIKGSYMGSAVPERDVPRFVALYKQGKLPIDKVRTSTIKLEDINKGFDRLSDGEEVRQMIDFGGRG